MKRITINKKEYTFKFSIEASLYDECTISVMDIFLKGGMAKGAMENEDVNSAMENLITTIANLPKKALTLFYAGLLEYHGTEGDKSIQSISDAKKLLADYLLEEKKSFRDVLGEMIDLMADDNFFDLIGLNQITTDLEKETESTKEGAETPSTSDGMDTSEKQ